MAWVQHIFLSTPSARRATAADRPAYGRAPISIHALREEGDVVNVFTELPFFDFYPRPPRGGRRGSTQIDAKAR